jgi:hypothetical protein
MERLQPDDPTSFNCLSLSIDLLGCEGTDAPTHVTLVRANMVIPIHSDYRYTMRNGSSLHNETLFSSLFPPAGQKVFIDIDAH